MVLGALGQGLASFTLDLWVPIVALGATDAPESAAGQVGVLGACNIASGAATGAMTESVVWGLRQARDMAQEAAKQTKAGGLRGMMSGMIGMAMAASLGEIWCQSALNS
jgi:hypothetical protein